MYKDDFYNAMIKYMEENGARRCWMSADEWTANTDLKFTPQRLTAMFKKGLVNRQKDFHYYGDNNYRYEPVR